MEDKKVREALIDALEDAGFQGRWKYDEPWVTALGAAIQTTSIVMEELIALGLVEGTNNPPVQSREA